MPINKSIIILLIILLSLAWSPRLFAGDYNLAAETLCSFGEAFLKQNRYAEAKHEFEKCLIVNPQHAQARKLLELCETKITPKKEKVMLSALEGAGKIIKPETPTKLTGEKKLATPAPEPKQEGSLAPSAKETTWGLRQGTWQLERGDFYTEIYTKYFWHNRQFTNGREKKRWGFDGKYNEIRTELKLEYGFNHKLTLLLYTVAKEAHWKDSFKSSTRKGFVETWPGIKYLLFDDPFLCWLRFRVKFPLHFSEQAVPALGQHQIDEEIKILTAQPWPKLPGYTKFELGFTGRNEEPSNEVIYFTQLGYNLTENLILELTLEGQTGVGGGKPEDWAKGTLGPIFKLGLLNLKFGYGNTFAGRNTSAGKELYFSIYTFW